MRREQRQELKTVSDEVAGWVHSAITLQEQRAQVGGAADAAVSALRRGLVDVRAGTGVAWRVLPLGRDDGRHLANLARRTNLPALSSDDKALVRRLTSDISAALEDIRTVTGARRFFSGGKKRDAGRASADLLETFRGRGRAQGISDRLRRLGGATDGPTSVAAGDAFADWVGLRAALDLGNRAEVMPAGSLADLPAALATIQKALTSEAKFRADAVTAGEAVRTYEVGRLLADMPVERLKEATRDRLRTTPLTDAGIKTVRSVLDRGAGLEHLPGIGATTATRIRGAAQTLWQTTYDEMPVRIDISARTSQTTDLLRRLGAWDAMRTLKGATADLAHATALTPLGKAVDRSTTHVVVVPVGSGVVELREAVAAALRVAKSVGDTTARGGRPKDPWDDFIARPADYFALLGELGFITEDEEKVHGDLPDDIVEAVRRLDLDTRHLTASLRGYQGFGARFALVQRKVVIGDEMGLGKTIEALAVLTHLRSRGSHHFLVVCPAAVVTNWVREVSAKSDLKAHRVHGPARDTAARSWVRLGGVAITTFETLSWFEGHLSGGPGVGCIVVDEAHYIKNPDAQRTKRVRKILDRSERAVLLTGTPLENRIEEFAHLVGYLRPDLIVDAGELAPRKFRRQVAPAYLRRNQEDVLTELPEVVEVDEWLPMSAEDVAAYRDAVGAGNFMAMRQAAMRATRSEKLQRLVEIVQEAEDNDRRVIVFSHFRDVLDRVAAALPGTVIGPLTGSVPAAKRQAMVDRFSAVGSGAVLVSQIVAGGVGLNIQAASVVVICEPQLKPTTEWQAIARARRMGQLKSVQVHRLLSEDGVDARITEILTRKSELFAEFARVSATADSAPEAYDVSEAELARQVVAAERERLFSASPDRS